MKTESKKLSLKDRFVDEITRGVLTGKYPVNEKLPTERELAAQMGISRTVVRSGIAELAANGILRQYDTRGWCVVDYRTEGEMPIVDAILTGGGEMNERLLHDYVEGGKLLQHETARLAAINRTNDDLYRLFTIIREGHDLPSDDTCAQANQVFLFHRQVAISSGNTFYPIFLNSMRHTAVCLMEKMTCRSMAFSDILKLEELVYDAIQERNPERAIEQMNKLIYHRQP